MSKIILFALLVLVIAILGQTGQPIGRLADKMVSILPISIRRLLKKRLDDEPEVLPNNDRILDVAVTRNFSPTVQRLLKNIGWIETSSREKFTIGGRLSTNRSFASGESRMLVPGNGISMRRSLLFS